MKGKYFSLIILLNLLLIFLVGAREHLFLTQHLQTMDVTLKWTFSTGDTFSSSPAVADLNGDGKLETIISSTDRNVYCLSNTGALKWNFSIGHSSFYSSPAVADLDEDGKLEIIIGSWDNNIYCLSNTGTLKWSFATENEIHSSPCVADLDGDGKLEVIFGSDDDKIYCLDNTGVLQWTFVTISGVRSSPAVADLDGDGKLEIIIGSWDNNIYCLTSTGTLKWNYTTDSWVDSSPAVADLDGDGKLEIIIGSGYFRRDGHVYCLNNAGGLKWVYAIGGPGRSSPAVADLNGDGKLEVMIGSSDGNIYCFSDIGTLKWKYSTGGAISPSSPSVADLDGDGKLEIIVGSRDNSTYCLSNTGTLKWKYTTKGEIHSSPCVADINHDGKLEIIVTANTIKPIKSFTYNYIGDVYCLALTGVSSSGNAPWYCFRGSLFHTGWMDSDSDYLDDLTEKRYFGTDPLASDLDSDGLVDGEELLFYSTDPFNSDTDDDGLLDGEEVHIYHTDPLNQDSDGDGFSDLEEILAGTNPSNKLSNPWSRRLVLILVIIFSPLAFFSIAIALIVVTSKRLKSKEQELIATVEPLLPVQTRRWLRKLAITPKVFVSNMQAIDQLTRLLFALWQESDRFPGQQEELYTLLRAEDKELGTIVLTLKLLCASYPLSLQEATESELQTLDKATARAISLLGADFTTNINGSDIGSIASLLMSFILKGNCSLMEAKIFSEIIAICENVPSAVPSGWYQPNVDFLGCQLLRAYWRRKEQGGDLLEFTLIEIAQELKLGILSSVLLLRELDSFLSRQQLLSKVEQPTAALPSSPIEEHQSFIEGYTTMLSDFFGKGQLKNFRDLGEVAERLNLKSLRLTLEVISQFFQDLLMEKPEVVAAAANTAIPFERFPVRMQPKSKELFELSNLFQIFEDAIKEIKSDKQ